jgi:hypothetical protein
MIGFSPRLLFQLTIALSCLLGLIGATVLATTFRDITIFYTAGSSVFGALFLSWMLDVWSPNPQQPEETQIAAQQAALKQQMLERGMPAEDIVRVLQTQQTPAVVATHVPIGALMAEKGYNATDITKVVGGWERLPSDGQATVRAMVEQEYNAVDIAKVLEACQEPAPPNSERRPAAQGIQKAPII